MTPDERDAFKTARRIESYWLAQGYPSVACEIVTVTSDTGSISHEVRCNLVNGLPVDFQAADLRRLGRTG
jgi:hypothetical protein